MAKDDRKGDKGKGGNRDAKNAKGAKGAKGKQGGKGGKGKPGNGGEAGTAAGPTIAGHPRACAQVRRAKGWGGLAGFGLAAYLSYSAGVTPDQIGLRALAAGIAGYMLAWACSVTVWRHVMLAEMRALIEEGRMAVAPKPAGAAVVPALERGADEGQAPA